jgi:general secretion pathway protein D
MQQHTAYLMRSLTVAAALAFLVPSTHAQTPAKNVSSKSPALNDSGITLNFNNSEISDVAVIIGTLMEKNVVIDPKVRGSMTLRSITPVTPGEAFVLFSAQLRAQGFAIIESDGLYTVLPEGDAKLRAAKTASGPLRKSDGGQVLTRIFKLEYESANALVPILRPLISPNNTINAVPNSNALVITDYADNLNRLARIIASLDKDSYGALEVIRLTHALAVEVAPLVREVIDAASAPPGRQKKDIDVQPIVVADARTNSLLIRGTSAAMLTLIRSVTSQLDQPAAEGEVKASRDIHVVRLKNADAEELAVTLRAALSSSLGSDKAPAQTSAAVSAQQAAALSRGTATATKSASSGGQIQADTSTNSLIISAPEEQYRQLLSVIDRLDARRAQVYVESLIAEISADKLAEFGVQWQGVLGSSGGGAVGILGTNFALGGANILDVTRGIATGNVPLSTGANLGIVSRVNGQPTLGLLARFLQSSSDANVLSTPNLVTLDNHEAKIVIGQNVPFVTGQYTNNNSANGSVNPFQTVERKDVGLTLRVKPQISEDGTVKMQIFQEVSRLDPASVNSAAGLITQKRSIESNVLVDDGSIVVLGGLLQDDAGQGDQKIPGLGDVPLFGNLFKAESKSRRKTNLMIFLRPVVLRSGTDVQKFSTNKYNVIREQQLQQQPQPSANDNRQDSAVIPELKLP